MSIVPVMYSVAKGGNDSHQVMKMIEYGLCKWKVEAKAYSYSECYNCKAAPVS